MNATLSADKSIGPISKTPVRHSKEDALDNLEFELLVDESYRLKPHTLRATAASYHAGRSLDPLALKAMMGWANLETAKKYIGQNVDNLARKLQFAHQ